MNKEDMSPLVPKFPVDLSQSALFRRRKSQDRLEETQRDTFNCDDYSVVTNSKSQQVQNAGYSLFVVFRMHLSYVCI